MNCPEACAPHRATCRQGGAGLADWRRLLPADWFGQVIEALDFASFHDYEMAAGRCFGYDEDGTGCYYAHDYAQEEIRSDDDESYYRVVTYGETVRAWRLRDGRWLNFRQAHGEPDGAPQRGFFMLTETPPRIPPRCPPYPCPPPNPNPRDRSAG